MQEITIKVNIDGDNYSEQQLRLLRFEREKHVLQELLHLGANIKYQGRDLTYEDVNYLSYEEATQVNLQAKADLGIEKIRQLYAESTKRSEQMWRDIVQNFDEQAEMIPARATLVVTGMTLAQYQEKLASVLSGSDLSVMSENPEHFQFTKMTNGDVTENLGMETMGMYGGPTEVVLMKDDPTIQTKVTADPGFPPAKAGTSRLLDGTLRHDIAHHQMRDIPNGFELRTCVYFPKGTPKEMIEGHKIHLALEAYEMIKAAAEA